MTPSTCPHPRRAFFRVFSRTGRLQVTERCLACGANPRPDRAWVSLDTVPEPVDSLPVLADYRLQTPVVGARQGDLFGGQP
jgi:hypothetical protein